MGKFKILIVLVVATVALVECMSSKSRDDLPSSESDSSEAGDDNEPLYVSEYIERGELEFAREKSRVFDPRLVALGINSYSGYVTVDKKYNSNIFFWYFPAQNRNKSAPVLCWHQGGES